MKGDPNAMAELGHIAETVDHDYEAALKWYQKAIKAGAWDGRAYYDKFRERMLKENPQLFENPKKRDPSLLSPEQRKKIEKKREKRRSKKKKKRKKK